MEVAGGRLWVLRQFVFGGAPVADAPIRLAC